MRYRLAMLTFVGLASPAIAADELKFGPVPSWVMKLPAINTAAEAGDAPISFLLSDSQVRLDPDFVENYSHNAVRINNPHGLAVGNVLAIWDPAFDTVTVHQVTIRRGDKQIDVLATGQKFTTLRREQNLEQQTLNGQLTATLQPEGLQVGDIVEVEMTVVRRDPTLRGHMEVRGSFTSPLRLERMELRVSTPAKARIRQRLSRGVPAATISKDGKDQVSSWTISPLVPEQAPAFAPPRYLAGKTLDVTDFQSWNDLAALLLPLFDQASVIPTNGPIQQELARIKAASADPAKRTELVLQLVEQKIRYVNLALGVGGLVPASAEQTWERRFGDCKAKSALLIGMLRAVGIDAVPVLVHTEEGDGLNERLPMVALFNHVIVRADIGGKTFWLDATRTGDVALDTLEVPFYHWGLPIVKGADLVKIMPGPRTQPYLETMIRTDASGGIAKPVPTTIELTMRGDLALAQNIVLSSFDPALREQAIRKQLQEKLDSFEIDKVSTSYDATTQVYRLQGEGRQTLDLNGGVYWTEVPSPGYKADFRRDGMRDRDAPVNVGYPKYYRTVQTIIFPKNRPALSSIRIDPISEMVAGIEYHRTVTNQNGVMTIDATERALAPEVPYGEAVAAQEHLRELDKMRVWLRLSISAPVETADVKQLIGREPKTSGDYVNAAVKYLGQDDGPRAMGALDKAIEMSPANAGARSLRAQLKFGAGDTKGARADAEAAIKGNPKDASLRTLLAEIYRQAGDTDAAFAEAQALAGIDNASAQISRGRILVSLGRTADALAAFDRALTYEKDPMTYVYRAQAMPAANKDARRAEVEAALKLNPSDASSLGALAQIESQLGDHDRALQLLDQAFLRSPDDIQFRHSRAVEMMLTGKKDAANREFDAINARDLSATELNNMCWAKALANVALDRALAECDRSLQEDDRAMTHDSRATVLLRQDKFDEAIKEYDVALENGEFAAPLYGRSLAYARKGDRAKSDADAVKAVQLSPGIDQTYAFYGLNR